MQAEEHGRFVNVVDLEATCWRGHPPPGQTGEILEIGICTVDTFERTRSNPKAFLVRPTRSSVSPFCTELTSITPQMVQDSPTFAEVCEQVRREYHTDSRPWFSWGEYDRTMLEGQSAILDLKNPFSANHTNLKLIFSAWKETRRRYGLSAAVQSLGLTLEGTHHRGVDDAWNTAAILLAVLAGTNGVLPVLEQEIARASPG
ncbi:MAG: exonuclease domain-containing protein [Pseudopedobacter sp.]|nr:exonuclease domain-containing protein [Deinococcales bacterium]